PEMRSDHLKGRTVPSDGRQGCPSFFESVGRALTKVKRPCSRRNDISRCGFGSCAAEMILGGSTGAGRVPGACFRNLSDLVRAYFLPVGLHSVALAFRLAHRAWLERLLHPDSACSG